MTQEIETRVPACEAPDCPAPTSPDWHRCLVCEAPTIQHAHVESRARAPHRKREKANIIPLCVPHHREVDERQGGVHSHFLKVLPGKGPTYWRTDIRGVILFERVLTGSPWMQEATREAVGHEKGDLEEEPMPVPAALMAVDQARQAIERIETLPEAKEMRDRASALRQYARAVGLGLQAQNDVADIKIRAERKAGQLLDAMELHPGGKPRSGRTMLPEMGIDKSQSHRWQRMASISDNEYEAYAQTVRDEGMELTSAGVLRRAWAFAHEGEEPRERKCCRIGDSADAADDRAREGSDG